MSQHFHFIGIGGVGMGSLASLMLSKGYRVSGSDIKESPMILNLRRQGARIFIGHHRSNIQQPNCVIYSSAVAEDNPEIQQAQKESIPVKKRAELLAQFVNSQTGITVAGAHGKTTTTAMIAHVLVYAGLDPSVSVGGIVNGAAYHARLGTGKYFVAEVDESDGSFLFFKPAFSVVTNIDFEHLDYYHNWENILQAYRSFLRQTKKEGCVFVYAQDPRLIDLCQLTERFSKTTTDGDNRRTRSLSDAKINKVFRDYIFVLSAESFFLAIAPRRPIPNNAMLAGSGTLGLVGNTSAAVP